MTANLRASLTILTIGFGIEGGGELYSLLTHGAFKPGFGLLVVVPAIVTLAGLAFVWVGRHEWNELHRDRVHQARAIFVASLLGGVIAAAVLALLAWDRSLGVPFWAQALFGGAVGSLVLGTFVTYAALVFHLVSRPSRVVLLASIVWALIVSAIIGEAFGANLPTLVGIVERRTFTTPAFLYPVDAVASYLFISYFLLLAAYVAAHRNVAKGAATAGIKPPPAPGGGA